MGLQPQRVRPIFREPIRREHNAPIRLHRPQAFIEHPVSVLAQRQAVLDVVILARGPRLNVRRVNNRCAIDRETCPDNNWRPPVKSIVLRRKRARKGVRLIEIASLRSYIRSQVQAEAATSEANHQEDPDNS